MPTWARIQQDATLEKAAKVFLLLCRCIIYKAKTIDSNVPVAIVHNGEARRG